MVKTKKAEIKIEMNRIISGAEISYSLLREDINQKVRKTYQDQKRDFGKFSSL